MENQGLISDSEWKMLISLQYAELYALLAETGMRYFETEESIDTTGGSVYGLPEDHLSTVGVDFLVNASTGERRQLQELMVQERNFFAGVQGAPEARAYALVGTNIVLYPTPPTGQTYKHVYIPQPADLSSAADGATIEMATSDGEAFLIWSVAVLALAKEESDTSLAQAEREAARERVWNWATLRALNTPRRRTVDSGPGLDGTYDPADYWGRGGSW